jgi:hypothetical protein
MKKYDIFGIGAALVDTEVVVTDAFLAEHGVDDAGRRREARLPDQSPARRRYPR